VITSDQIAQQTQAFQQQAMMNMHHSGMVSQYAGSGVGGGNQQQAGGMMGSAMNTTAAIGAPVASGALMLAGMDPMSMGMKAAWGARGGGMLAAGGAGVAAAGAVAMPLMAAQYAGSQMFQGAQQQQQLESRLGATYQFGNQYGGRGFGASEMGNIGESMRHMTQQRGPGGEFSTMDEMGRLAANMGRMGMAQGVRNAKEFNEKFQEMMKAVTTIATEMGTSLEQAQQLMSSARSSGAFSKGSQLGMVGAIHKGAIGGGMATEELSQMANIGSQVSRAIGGRGQAGAFAGIAAISRVGAAVQSGTLSEEDIYNATGQTGAAGRQAMAATMVQGDAQFFKGGLGRRVLASVAGKDGQINQEDVDEYIHGTVGTGKTMQMAHKNLAKVGRANFIRNEGRLRGEAMRAFGGLGRAVVARQWLGQRGHDLDSMDDRSMIFFQRRFGMDADQAENLLKMTRSMGSIQGHQESAAAQDHMLKQLERQNKHTGIEGVKRKFENARKSVNDSLQQVGADFYKEGQNVIEGFINKLTDGFVATIDRDVGPAARVALRGGELGKDTLSRRFGINMGGRGAALESFKGAPIFGGSGTGISSGQFKELNADSFKAAGYDISGYREGGLQEQLKRYEEMSLGMHQTDTKAMGFGAGMASHVRLQSSMMHGKGANRQKAFSQVLQQLAADDKSGVGSELLKRYERASGGERSAIMSSILRGAGVDSGEDQMGVPEAIGIFGNSAFATTSDRHRAIAQYAFKGKGDAEHQQISSAAGVVGKAGRALTWLSGIGVVAEGLGAGDTVQRKMTDFGNRLFGAGTPNSGTQQAMGSYLDSEEGRKTMEGITSDSEEVRDKMRREVTERAYELNKRRDSSGDLSNLEGGELLGLQSAMMTDQYLSLKEKYAGGEIPESELRRAAARFSGAGVTSVEQFLSRASVGPALLQKKQREARAIYFRTARSEGKSKIRELVKGGILTAKGISADMDAKLSGVGKSGEVDAGDGTTVSMSAGQRALRAYVKAQQARSLMGSGTGAGADEQNMGYERQAQEGLEENLDLFSHMSHKELQQYAKDVGGDSGSRARSIDSVKERISRGGQKGGQAGRLGAIAGMLGLGVQTKDFRGKKLDEQMEILESALTGGLSAEDFGGEGLKDLDSAIRLEKDPAKKEKLMEERQKLLEGGASQLDAVKKSTGRMKEALALMKKGGAKGLEEGTAILTREAEGLQGAGIKVRDNNQDAAAKASDPSYRKLEDIATHTKDMITAIKSMSTAVVTAVEGGASPEGPPAPAGG